MLQWRALDNCSAVHNGGIDKGDGILEGVSVWDAVPNLNSRNDVQVR
jgi:hypothetical protein